MMFESIMRLMPTIPFAKNFNEKIQGMALCFHLRKALNQSSDISDFKFNISLLKDNKRLNSRTREILEKITKQVDELQDEIIEQANKKLEISSLGYEANFTSKAGAERKSDAILLQNQQDILPQTSLFDKDYTNAQKVLDTSYTSEEITKNARVFPNELETHKVASATHNLTQSQGGTSHNQNPSNAILPQKPNTK
ncbi:hypothetical protein ACRE1U_04390 [Helicobacter himalayensis]|uniref:hypothetical protein n=1 Tax=Helicobacter himalayensis TaxID=1591088 RepID=UPI003D6F1BAC